MANNVIVFTIKGVSSGAVKAVNKLRASLGKIVSVGAVVGTALVAGFAAAVKSIIDVGSTTENLRIRLDALLGSTQEGGKAFKQMAEFASTVPFSFEEIIESSTSLAAVVKGGADEVASLLPHVADIAAVTGLTLQQTSEQMQRVFSAGIGAADLFREKSVGAMLGFQTGVAISAEESRKKMIEALEDPASKFRGAAVKMATTWDGVLSMIGDKWFNFKSQIANAGVFNYIKSIAIAIDQLMGEALKDVGDTAKETSNSMIEMFKGILVGVGFVADAVRGLEFAWAAVQLVFAKVAEFIIIGTFELTDVWRKFFNLFPSFETVLLHLEGTYNTIMGTMLVGVFALTEGFRKFANMTGLIDIEPLTGLENLVKQSAQRAVELEEKLAISTATINIEPLEMFEAIVLAAKDRSAELGLELDLIALKPMPSEAVDDFQARIDKVFNTLQTKKVEITKSLKAPLDQLTDFQSKWQKAQKKFYGEMENSNKKFADDFFKLMESTIKNVSSGIATVVVEGGDLMKTFENIGREVLKSILASIIAMGIQSLITNKLTATSKVGAAGAAGIASMAAAPFPVNLSAPAFGAAMASTAAGFAAAAHGGLTNVPSESTYLLQKGERVLSPNQNSDFTDFISNESGSGSSGGGVSVENLTIHILENASNADALFEMDRSDMEELVAEKIIPALDSLDSQGIKMESVSRGNI